MKPILLAAAAVLCVLARRAAEAKDIGFYCIYQGTDAQGRPSYVKSSISSYRPGACPATACRQ